MANNPNGIKNFLNNLNTKKSEGAKTTALGGDSASTSKNVQKNWKFIGIAGIGGVILLSALFSSPPPKREITKKVDDSAATINVTPTSQVNQTFQSKYGNEQAMLRQKLEQMERDRQKTDEQLKKLTEALANKQGSGATATPEGVVAPPIRGDNSGGLEAVGAPPAPPVPKAGQGIPLSSSGQLPPSITPIGEVGSIPRTPSVTSYPAPTPVSSESDSANVGGTAGGVNARSKFTKNRSAGLLPAGSFAPISLMNGIDAGTSDQTRSNPVPVLMQINDFAVLPGKAKYDIRSCFLLGSGYGDPSSERVYMRFSRISCMNNKNRLVLSQEVSGYVVDSDGKVGMRGVITERQGALLYKSTLAGFAQGLTGALGSAQGTVLSNLTTGTTTSTLNGTAALRASGLSGAQSAASQLAEFYLKQAQNVFSVITVDAGRLGSVVFTNSASLTWSDADSQYVEQVTPTNN